MGSLVVHNSRIPGMFAAIGPAGEIISYPLNADCVMLGRTVSYDKDTSRLRWRSAWSGTAPEIESLVYLSNEGSLAGKKCSYVEGDLIVAYRSPRVGEGASSPNSMVFSDWVVFSGGGGDASCAPGTTLYASKIVLTTDCEDPEGDGVERIELDGEKIAIAKPQGSATVDLKQILQSKIVELRLCSLEGEGSRIVKVLGVEDE